MTKRFMSLKEVTLISRRGNEHSVLEMTTLWLLQSDEHVVRVHPESALSLRHGKR